MPLNRDGMYWSNCRAPKGALSLLKSDVGCLDDAAAGSPGAYLLIRDTCSGSIDERSPWLTQSEIPYKHLARVQTLLQVCQHL